VTKKLRGRLGGTAPHVVVTVKTDAPSLLQSPSPNQACADLTIEHAITNDNFGGEPWPPNSDGWCLVRSLNGWRTLWRRITLADIAVDRPCGIS